MELKFTITKENGYWSHTDTIHSLNEIEGFFSHLIRNENGLVILDSINNKVLLTIKQNGITILQKEFDIATYVSIGAKFSLSFICQEITHEAVKAINQKFIKDYSLSFYKGNNIFGISSPYKNPLYKIGEPSQLIDSMDASTAINILFKASHFI